MSRLSNALATCRRVLLLLLLGVTLLGAWVYMQMPRLDDLRPSIESYLKQELQLDTLRLGKLSWYWAGFLWIESDKLDFETRNHAIAYQGGRISVRVPLFKLLIADIAPDRIRLSGGRLQLKLDKSNLQPAAAPAALPGHLVLDGVDLSWQYGDLSGRLPALHLFIDGDSRVLKLHTAELQLYMQLDPDMLPHALHLTCSGNSWLPVSWQPLLERPAGELRLFRSQPTHWSLETKLKQPQGTTIRLARDFALPLNLLTARLELTASREKQGGALRLTAAELHDFHWQQARNDITASGRWQQGKLTLDAASSRLAMPLLWSWLKPFGDEAWQQWLSRMQHGLATDSKAHLELPWSSPLTGLPTAKELAEMRYQVHGKVDDADIALGLSSDDLTGIRANVELDESGLHAHVRESQLPLGIGKASGELLLPWNTLELHITGTATADAARLGAWQAPELLDNIEWQQATSHVNFMLRWSPPQPEPTEATVVLQPESEWQLKVAGLPVTASGGTLQWDNRSGLSMNSMQVRTPHMLGKLSLAANRNAAGLWQVNSVAADVSSDFANLASHFELPVGSPEGSIETRLNYDGQWHGTLDLGAAGWSNLLGSTKAAGTPYQVELTGSANAANPFGDIHIDHIDSRGDALQLQGSGKISARGLNLKLDHIKSTFFDGGMQIRAPFGPTTPWELDVKAAVLYRKALPAELGSATTTSKPWALRANIDHFIWDEASLSGVSIQLASSAGSVGVIEAKQVHTAQTDLLNVRSMFSLPGGGRIDLRHLSANIEKQQISLSATLEPAADGGMRWQGFAEINGDFGHLMQRGGLSERFTGGRMHALFSGRGVVMREQPWWKGMDGRLRLRVDKGRIQEGGSLTKLLAAFNLADLPKLLTGQRKDLTGSGLMYDRLQMEGIVDGKEITIRNVVLRSAAFDLAGRGKLDVDADTIDLLIIARPLQNLDALLSKIPLLRDILGGAAHSLMRKVYRMHGKFSDATVESVDPQQVGLASPGLVESLLSLPQRWFGSEKPATK